ncbi:hypothetical protein [Gordonia ajococcus]|uniref:AbiTii domain-containing protein n=1 Tax=Gordonia ajococcus TaxID=1292359 RepID=UPI001785108A|nr:hypothetical protein [Gordonia ajococcus]
MSDEGLLVALSEHCIDGSYSLADLLRECLMLGARTGSDALREWAGRELHGYGEGQEVPEYRRNALPLFRDVLAGQWHRTAEQIHRYQVPSDLREAVLTALIEIPQ